jgi:hypothetical protein
MARLPLARPFATASGLCALILMLHCGGSDSSDFPTGISPDGSAGMSSGSSGTDIPFPSQRDGGPKPGNGKPELCDGIDNDENGIIDDLDVGNDGICDCLQIATLGAAGKWGKGDVFGAWLNSRGTSGAAALGAQELTRPLLDKYQVIVVQDVSENKRTYAPAEVAALSDWIHAGGGLITLIGYGAATEIVNVNTLLAPLGASYGAEQILPKSGINTVAIGGWTAHPVTDGIVRVGVDNGYPVQGAGASLATEAGRVVLRGQQIGEGHLLVWGDEWISYNSEWVDHPDYQVERFWLNMIKWSSPAKTCQVPVPANIK